jgi:secretion/DNA translocation related TadE-like protein
VSALESAPRRGAGAVGAATVVVVGIGAAAVLLGGGVIVFASSAAEHSRATSAADLAALAGSDVARGIGTAGDPCAAARRAATGSGATLTSCTLLGGDGASIEVAVQAVPQGAAARWLPLPRATATSWAGAPPT